MARVGFDIDGVLYPFEVEFHRYAFKDSQFDGCDCLPVSTWNFYEEWGYDKDWFIDTCNRGVTDGVLFWQGEPYSDAIEQVQRVYDAGHKVVFITSRNYGGGLASERATRFWLRKHLRADFELHLTQDKTTVQVDYFIDDNIDHYEAMRGVCDSFLCLRPWNEHYFAGRSGSLKEFVGYVLDREHPSITPDEAANWVSLGRKPETQECWTCERNDVLYRFAEELEKATGDGSKKRQAGEKPPWYRDDSHEGAIFSHLMKWKRGELVDPDSGAHPLVHAAWRCLAIACSESGNHPDA